MEGKNIITLKDEKTIADPIFKYSAKQNVPIIIDNGSYQCRVGWANESKPCLIFRNIVAKPRKDRFKKDEKNTETNSNQLQNPPILVGNDIINIEAMRFQLKTQFDKNVVTEFEVQEQIFDYIFSKLGINTVGRIQHPIIITESFLNPNYSRQLMNELLFECYNVESVCYGVDAFFSAIRNQVLTDSLVVSFGYHTTHCIPILNGHPVFDKVRRINLGGYHIAIYLQRILQLKYPRHAPEITLSRIEEIMHEHCYVALDYFELLSKWEDPTYYAENARKIQLPFTPPTQPSALNVEQQKERKRELARRLIEINAKKRQERLQEEEERLEQILQIKQEYLDNEMDIDEVELRKVLEEHSLTSKEDLLRTIQQLMIKITKIRQKIEESQKTSQNQEESLTNKNTIVRNSDELIQLVSNAKRERLEILEKKLLRKQKRQDMAKRRTSAAQERMRIISQLARNEKGKDDFGMRDEDWDVYKTISRDGGDSDSEQEQERLLELEGIIRQHDPNDNQADMTPESYQLDLGVELSRGPELLFQPSMGGVSEAGILEIIEYILKLFDSDEQSKLVEHVFLTGGPAIFSGMKERFEKGLREMRPFESKFKVDVAKNPSLDCWFGIYQWIEKYPKDFEKAQIRKKDYTQSNGDILKTHIASNMFNSTPVVLQTSTLINPEQIDSQN